MLAHMQMRPFIATYKAASTKFKSYTVYYMCVACTFVHTRTHTHHKHTRTRSPNGIIAESNGCVPCASTQKKERNIWWMTFVNERQRNRLHAHCCNVCKVLLSSLSCSRSFSPSNITRIFTFNSSVIIAIAYKSWFLFCFFVFHSFSNGYFFAMHSFVYIFWTENNTPNATFTQTLNLNLPCTKKMRDFGVYRWIFRHIYSTSVAQRFVHNCYFGKWIFVFFSLFRGSFNSCRQKSSTKFAYILQIFNFVDWIENKTFNAKCVCTEQKKNTK